VPYKFLFYILIHITYVPIGTNYLFANDHKTSQAHFSENQMIINDKNTSITENQKFKQRARLERTIASDLDHTSSRTKVVSYLIVLFLPLLVGFWLMKKKGL